MIPFTLPKTTINYQNVQKILNTLRKIPSPIDQKLKSLYKKNDDSLKNNNTPEPLTLPDPNDCREIPPECDINGICSTVKIDCSPID